VIIIKKKFKVITTIVITIIVLVGVYFFAHSTPQRAIRTSIFLDGHIIKAFKTEIYKNGVDPQYGQLYSCRDPQVGGRFYTWEKSPIGLWFVSIRGEG
jgi:hypothetical protein